jgi:hypothetical protein
VSALHKKELTIITFALILVTLLLSIYFMQNIYHDGAKSTTRSSVINGLQLSLTLDAKTTTYKQGQVINVTVALTNVGQKAMNVSFNNSYLGFEVRNSENVTVWEEESPLQPTGTLILAPQKSVNDVLIWNTGSYRNQPQASIGVYQFVGFLVIGFTEPNSTRSFQTAPLNITITKLSLM